MRSSIKTLIIIVFLQYQLVCIWVLSFEPWYLKMILILDWWSCCPLNLLMLQRFMDYLLTILIFWFLINRKINLTLDWLSAAIGIQGCVLCTTNVYFAVFGGNTFCNGHHQRWSNDLLVINKCQQMINHPSIKDQCFINKKGVDLFWI